jgi:diketogulonate reductase-like aldo/keto reductase
MALSAFTLNNSVNMPAIGFGTWEISPNDKAKEITLQALEVGYRLLDTAKLYGNEEGVGAAVRDSGISRADIFVTTKLWNTDQGYDTALQAFDTSLEKLGLDYVDLYLIHWPSTPKRAESWRALQEIYERGNARCIGVSNYTIEHLRELLEHTEVVPAVNQVEFHPYMYTQQKELLDFCNEHNIQIEAYSPLSRGMQQDGEAQLSKIGEKYNKTASQVVLRWCTQHGTIPLPRSQNSEHIHENFDIFDFELSAEDVAVVNNLSTSTPDA